MHRKRAVCRGVYFSVNFRGSFCTLLGPRCRPSLPFVKVCLHISAISSGIGEQRDFTLTVNVANFCKRVTRIAFSLAAALCDRVCRLQHCFI
jgi:hypothetical protein